MTLGGSLYAFAADTGQLLWTTRLGAPLGGGIITYKHEGLQRIAVAAGLTSAVFPTATTHARVMVFGLDSH